jgi:hypothetical protein
MMEDDWIAMPGVPLIAAGNPEVTAEEGGRREQRSRQRCSRCRRDNRADVR